MADGRLWFNTKIDNTGVEKDLRDLENKIKKSQEKISKAENAKLPLESQLKSINEELEKGKIRLESYKKRLEGLHLVAFNPKTAEDKQAAKTEIPIYQEKVAAQEEKIKHLQSEWEKTNNKVKDYEREIEQANIDIDRNKAKAGELTAQLNSGGAKMQVAFDKARNSANRFGKRMLEIAKGALVFNVVSAVLRGVVNYMGKVLKSNSEYTAQLAKLKGALLTAFQPIYEFVLPGVLAVMRVLTAIAQVVANVLSFLFGKTAKESANNAKALNAEAEAIDGVGNSAKKAQKSLAGFDEINTLNSTKTEDSNVGGGGGAGVVADFSEAGEITKELEAIAKIVLAIAAGLLTWKVSSLFTGGLNATSAALGLLVAGIMLVVMAINEWITTGELSNEMCIALVAGIVAIGGAISLLTRSWIPLIIAAVVGLVLAVATKGDEIKGLLQKFDDWLQGVFAKDWTEVFGPVLGSVLNGFFGVVKNVWSGVKKIFDGIIDFVGAVFKGDWQKAWDSVVGIFKGAWESFGAIFQPVIDALSAAWTGLGNLLPQSWQNAINAVVKVVNKFISWLNNTLTFDIPPIKVAGVTLFSGGSVKLINIPPIPMLAKGAVIPPNAPFMAMLGDQKHGTNIEAPLSTIQEAVAAVMQDYAAANLAGHEATVAVLREILEAVLGIEIGDKVIADAVRRYNSRMAVVKGG